MAPSTAPQRARSQDWRDMAPTWRSPGEAPPSPGRRPAPSPKYQRVAWRRAVRLPRHGGSSTAGGSSNLPRQLRRYSTGGSWREIWRARYDRPGHSLRGCDLRLRYINGGTSGRYAKDRFSSLSYTRAPVRLAEGSCGLPPRTSPQAVRRPVRIDRVHRSRQIQPCPAPMRTGSVVQSP